MIIVVYIFDFIINLNASFDLIIQITVGVTLYFILLKLMKLEEYKLVYKFQKFN